jgi:hypothetical protein
MNKIIELRQDFEFLQAAWNKLYNQFLNSSTASKSDIQAIENKMNKVQSDIVNLDIQENTQVTRTQKLADAHKWMDSHYHNTFERLANFH